MLILRTENTMKNIIYTICLLFIIAYIASSNLLAQTTVLPNYRSSNYEGTHFLVAFMQNEISTPSTGNDLILFITSAKNAIVNVKSNGASLGTYNIQAGQMQTLNFDSELYSNKTSEVISKQTIEVISDVPIMLYGFNTIRTSSDVFAGIPISCWGTEYVASCYPNDQYFDKDVDSAWGAQPRRSEFLILSAYDSTVVTFQPKTITAKGKQYTQSYSVTLNKNDSYLVQSYGAPAGQGDLSGTIIQGNKPFGVISGHVRTAIPQTIPYPWDSKNHLIEMLFPTSAWGKHYISTPFIFDKQKNGNLFRVNSIHSNTAIDIKTQSGAHYQYSMDSPGDVLSISNINEPAEWVSSDPIQITQLMQHTGNPAEDNQFYDPSMVVLPPVEQFVSKIIFQVPGNSSNNPTQFIAHYASLIVDTTALETLRFDGTLLTDISDIQNNHLLNTPYYWTNLKLESGAHQLVASKGTFSGILYGYGQADAYSVTLGSSLTNYYKYDSIPPIVKIKDECGNIRGDVSEVIDTNASGIDFATLVKNQTNNYDVYISNISDTCTYFYFTAKPLDRSKDGDFAIEIRDKNGNGQRYTYHYNARLFSYGPTAISLGDFDWTDSTCTQLWIKNNGVDSVVVNTITIGDSRVSVHTDKPLPCVLHSGDSLAYKVCFAPKGNPEPLNTNILVQLDCNDQIKTPITAFVKATDILVTNYDFGSIAVGKDSCTYIYLVNKGNVPITSDYVQFDSGNSQFTVDSTGLFPKTLNPGDTLKLKVCFIPVNSGDFQFYVDFKVNNKSYRSDITGKGIFPVVNSINYDWKEKRVGTTNNYNIVLTNSGTASCQLSFSKILDSKDGFYLGNIENLNHYLLNPGESLSYTMSFIPTEAKTYTCNIELVSDNHMMQPIEISLQGTGTLPVIATYDNRIDNTIIYHQKDTSLTILKAAGNENLSIQSIKIKSGNTSDFILDLTPYQSIKLKPNDELKIPVKFYPHQLGDRQITLEIISDAAPNYATATNEAIINGLSIPEDTNNVYFDVISPESIYYCQSNLILPYIINKGNVDAVVNSISFNSNDFKEIKWIDSLKTPTVIHAGDTLRFKLSLLCTNNEKGFIQINSIVNDTIKINKILNITPIKESIILSDLNEIQAQPADTVSLSIKGHFPYAIDTAQTFNLALKINHNVFDLISKQYNLICGTDTIPVAIKQTNDSLFITLSKKIELKTASDFNIKLDFLILLYDDYKPQISVITNISDCFNNSEIVKEALINKTCGGEIRLIAAGLAPSLKLSPNPVATDLCIESQSEIAQEISLEIIDRSGKIVLVKNNIRLPKGEQSIKINMSDLSSGAYIIRLKSKYFTQNSIFIKTN